MLSHHMKNCKLMEQQSQINKHRELGVSVINVTAVRLPGKLLLWLFYLFHQFKRKMVRYEHKLHYVPDNSGLSITQGGGLTNW